MKFSEFDASCRGHGRASLVMSFQVQVPERSSTTPQLVERLSVDFEKKSKPSFAVWNGLQIATVITECSDAHNRGFEMNLGSDVVLWVNVARVREHSPIPVPCH